MQETQESPAITIENIRICDIARSEAINEQASSSVAIAKAFQSQFDEVDLALQTIKSEIPHLLDRVVEEYTHILAQHAQDAGLAGIVVFPSTDFKQESWKVLRDYPNILDSLQRAMFAYLGVSEASLNLELAVTVPMPNYIRFAYFHVYYLFSAIEAVESRESAREIARKFAEALYTRPRANQVTHAALDDYRQRLESNCLHTHNYISGKASEGRFLMKVTRCIWGESLREVEDPNLMYYLICYGDFFSAPRVNPNFSLTRNSTILQGGEWCDFCYHDARETADLPRHPSERFWNLLK